MLADRVVGKEGIPTRERSNKNLQRSQRTRGDQHVCAENGPWSSECADNRRLEVVVDGLPLFGGVQLAVDTTLGVSSPGRRSARRKKARTDLELVGSRCSGSSGGVGPGGERKMVPGGQHVCQVARKGQGEVGARCGATPNGAGVEAPVEFDPGVGCCTRFSQVLFSD